MQNELPAYHPGLSEGIRLAMEQSLIEGGANLEHLPVGGLLLATTRNTRYRIERIAPGSDNHPFLISGHPRICPTPRRAGIPGSTWGAGGMLRVGFIGRGMHMEFYLRDDDARRTYTTTTIGEIVELDAGTADE